MSERPPEPVFPTTVFGALLDAGRHYGRRVILDDADGTAFTHGRLVLAALILGRRLARDTAPGEAVGVLLPNASATIAVFFALNAFGRVPAMLNFTAGPINVAAATVAADIRTVVTSRRFIREGGFEAISDRLGETCRIVWLEDVRRETGTTAKVAGLADRAKLRLTGPRGKPNEPAVILFTSGTEGKPKGVVLSHANMLANCTQISESYPVGPDDVVFNPLPVFHSFGLTVGVMLPMTRGSTINLYPSPLHYKQIPPLLKKTAATILIGTDTFLANYARTAEPDEVKTLKMVVAGAERVRDRTRAAWAKLGDMPVIEGYGATEAAPIISANPYGNMKPGTVGVLMPWIEHRLEPVPGLDEGGRLHVRGPNVMAGYLRSEAPGRLEPPPDGWHDTGDIVSIDAEGFITIKGRAKRFAKLGGEMVSLTAVEAYASSVWPDANHAAVAVPDSRKGEQIILVSDGEGLAREDFVAWAREHGVPELMIPRTIIEVDALPVLGTGKTDYPALQAAAESDGLRAAAE